MEDGPLGDWVVVDLSEGIPGAYATKVLTDGGARVIKVESPSGDPLRAWAGTAENPPVGDGALFRFLSCGKHSVVVDPTVETEVDLLRTLLAGADVVVWSPESPFAAQDDFRPAALHEAFPSASIVAITPFGLEGPWADRPASELVLQALSGGAGRGLPTEPPRTMGGYVGEWLGGMFAALSALLSRRRPAGSGGELIDLSLLESLVLCQFNHEFTYFQLAGRAWHPRRAINVPDIEPTRDGYVGIMVVTAQMWQDFCVMVEHPEWLEDQSLYSYAGRLARRDELTAAIREWTSRRTTDEVLELAGLFRMPAAPVGTGETIPALDHFAELGFFAENPAGFQQPTVPYVFGARLDGPVKPAPALGEHTADYRAAQQLSRTPRSAARSPEGRDLPLQGIRVLDFTSFWAGPIAAQVMAMFGAEVIHVESTKRPDGFRGHTVRTAQDDLWWEWTPAFHASNTNKLGLTLDMGSPEGRALATQLVAESDVVIDNYSPRVMDSWGFDFPSIHAINPKLVMVRMPAFGLSGPWRDRTGFAQTMEQISGMSHLTGFPDGEPTTLNGPCDPIAGIHAAIALVLALEQRDRSGEGMLVESIMVASALNIAAELVVSESAYGKAPTRSGNRGYRQEFQNVYRCCDPDDAGDDRWVAVVARNDDELTAMLQIVGVDLDPPDRARVLSRFKDTDAASTVDSAMARWCGSRSSADVLGTLLAAGIPAAPMLAPHEAGVNEQLYARGFFEEIDHPICGSEILAGFPARFSAGPHRMHRTPAPTLGQHNADVLGGVLGLRTARLNELEQAGIIGSRIAGSFRSR